MILSFKRNNKDCFIDTKRYYDISIPMFFDGEQPNSYSVPKASSKAFQDGQWIGDTRKGGSCNFETLTINTHCNGTHTECIGHILNQRVSINQTLQDKFILAKLITINAISYGDSKDKYDPIPNDNELVISSETLQDLVLLQDIEALIIRTLPNPLEKKYYQYGNGRDPIFFTNDAMKILADSNLKHILLDSSSVDRLYDDGKLTNHRIWWDVEQDTHEANPNSKMDRTITEFTYVNNTIVDGEYMLNIELPAFESDAAPSRPVIYPLENI